MIPSAIPFAARRSLSPAFVFLGVFVVYLYCLYPAFAPRDSADLARAALTLGVAHPPGYPLYFILGKVWLILFPLGNPAYRLNVLSAMAGAAAAAALFRLCERSWGFWPALGSALGLAFSSALWKFSLLEEMYSWQALFIVLLLLLAEGPQPSLLRRAYFSALLFGLGLVDHQSLVLFLPGLIVLWHDELRLHGRSWSEILPGTFFFALLGVSLYAAVAVRLGSPSLASAVITRAAYGSFQLFGGFSRPLTADLAAPLLLHFASGLLDQSSPLLLALAVIGAYVYFRGRPLRAAGLFLSLAAFGPLFFLMTRFDLSSWVAATALEPAFIAPLIFIAVLAAAGLSRLESWQPRLGPVLALAAALAPLALHASRNNHREDFSAYDYANDLRRMLPPGGLAVVRGDTALFALKYLEALKPSGRVIVSELEQDNRSLIESSLATRPVFVTGLGLEALKDLGLAGNPYYAVPAGLLQRVSPAKPTKDLDSAAWELSTIRAGPPLESGESYARDIRLSYAFAHYVSGRLHERLGDGLEGGHYELAALWDPADFQLAPAKP